MPFCKFCSKECKNKNSLINHERLCKSNSSRVPSWLELNRGTYTHYNQYTKPGSNWTHSEESRERMSLKAKGRLHTEEYKEKMRVLAHERELGGHTSKKRMDYTTKSGKILHLHSSYEVKFAELLDSLQIEWTRPTYILWNDDGTVRRYYPDFRVGDMYFDTKTHI